MSPLVTVCLPVFNGAAHIEACMRSISAQTYEHIEILAVDNCSTDSTPELLRSWAAEDHRVRIVTHPRNLGLVKNFNACVAHAQGDWLKFIMHDDTLEPACVEQLLDACLAAGCRMGACHRVPVYEGWSEEQLALVRAQVEGGLSLSELLPGASVVTTAQLARLALRHRGRNFIGEPTAVLLHRSVFEEFGGFNVDLLQIPDLEYWLRVGLNTGVAYLDKSLATFRVHRANASNTNWARNAFRAGRLDHLILLHEYLFNQHYHTVRASAREDGSLAGLFREFRRQARRVAFRAAMDGRSQDQLIRQHYAQWREAIEYYPRLRVVGVGLAPLLAAAAGRS